MAAKTFSTFLSELSAVTGLGSGDRIPVLESSAVKYVDGADVGGGGGGGGITALTGDVTASGTGSVAATIANLAVTNAKVATGIDAAKIADGTVSNAEFQYLGSVTSDIQTQLNAKQTLDSDLTTIAGLAPTNDDVMQYKAGAWANRTIAQLKTDLSLSGSNTGDQDLSGLQPLDATLTALSGLTIAANSLTIGTAADTFSQTSFAANTFPARASTGNLVAKSITDFGLSLVDDADASTARTTLGLGTLATQSGTFSGTSSGTNTGDQTISLTGDVTGSGTGSFSATIANSAVTLAKMADMATASILGRNTAGAGAPEVLSASTTKTLLSLNNVENTALSTWAGTTNITTLGTISTGTWSGTEIAATKGGTGLTALGTALQQLRVNAGGTALEYFTPSGGGSGDILDGGNTTGAAVTIGTNDAFGLNLETTGVTRMAITGGASTGGQVTITNVTANTNTVSDGITIQTNSTGTAAASFGGGILFQGESSTTDSQDMVRLSAIWTTATHPSRASALVYSDVTAAGALTERFRFTPAAMTLATNYTVGNSSSSVTVGGAGGTVVLSSSSSSTAAIQMIASNNATGGITVGNSNFTSTTLNKKAFQMLDSYVAASGTGVYTAISILSTYNLTGTASGVQKGIHINPTLTSLTAATYRAIDIESDNSAAKGVYQSGSSTTNNFVGATGFGATTAPTDKVEITGNLALLTAGNKIKIATGSNASAGVSGAMTAGTITISTTAVTASSLIYLTHASVGGTVGILSVGTITAGTSFVINSSSASDTSTVNWWIVN